ncbi:MAG TPA: hypothetical protein VLA88_05380 [Candidatus Saccharimonadales bacterium]|nr:hypothetical protein [Candidatus Saccharimonadales bacterium]
MELLKAKATRNRVSEAIYIGLNALLPIAVFALVELFDPPYLAVGLVLLSKWRIFALRPRYWWVSIKANMVDVLVGLSVVGLLYLSTDQFALKLLITLGYAAWLLMLKPRSNAQGVMLQAGVAQFASLVVLFHFYRLPEFVVLLGCWAIGYIAARHVVSNYEEPHIELMSALWGLVLAQLGWLAWRWTVAYHLGPLPIMVPQIALIMLVVGFCAARMYHANKHDRMTPPMLRGTAIFGAVLLAVILIFSPWDATV